MLTANEIHTGGRARWEKHLGTVGLQPGGTFQKGTVELPEGKVKFQKCALQYILGLNCKTGIYFYISFI